MSHFDEVYSETPHFFGHEPSQLLDEFHHLIPSGGWVLDIGVGHGRNAVFLARRGIEVEGVDTSSVGLGIVGEIAAEEGLPIVLHQCDVMEFSPHVGPGAGTHYDAVLALGIVPLLPRGDVDVLFGRIDTWTKPGGLVFVTTYTTSDKRFSECVEDPAWEREGVSTFRRGGRIRTFLERDEIVTLLPGYEVVHHREGLSGEHRHGDGPPERHFLAQLLARKP